jgi:hypothetical protein
MIRRHTIERLGDLVVELDREQRRQPGAEEADIPTAALRALAERYGREAVACAREASGVGVAPILLLQARLIDLATVTRVLGADVPHLPSIEGLVRRHVMMLLAAAALSEPTTPSPANVSAEQENKP